MKETYDFRLFTDKARLVLGPDYETVKGSRPGFDVYRVKGIVGDPLYRKMEEADRVLAQSSEKGFIAGWSIKRTYADAEIERAQLFLIQLSYAEGAGEEFGTWYTDVVPNRDCAFERTKTAYGHNQRDIIGCALSSRQVGPLRFPYHKMRKGRDIFGTWAGELVVSGRLAKLIETGSFTGGNLNAIWNIGVKPKSMPDLSEVPSGKELLVRAEAKGLGPNDKNFWSWIEEQEQMPQFDKALFEQMNLKQSRRANASPAESYFQLSVQSTPLTVSSNTVIGSKPFRPGSGESCSCGFGEVQGKMLLSPLSVIGSSWDGSDICQSDVYVGGRAGLFRPSRLLVISKRLFDAMRQAGMKGFDFEVVEMV
jgi:hypothetical protein